MCGTPAELWQHSHDEKVTTFLKDPSCLLITFYVDSPAGSAVAEKPAPPAESTEEMQPERTLVALFGMPIKQVTPTVPFRAAATLGYTITVTRS